MFFHHKELQRNGRNKDTVINRNYIESGEYRKKFDQITSDKELNRLLYNCAKEMLYHRSGSVMEDMYWIDPISKQVVAKERNQSIPHKILYSRATKKKICKYKGLITIHTHPSSYPPSIEDFNSNYLNEYSIGIICCHDGKVYKYISNKMLSVIRSKMKIDKYILKGYSNYEAQILFLEDEKKLNNIWFEEA